MFKSRAQAVAHAARLEKEALKDLKWLRSLSKLPQEVRSEIFAPQQLNLMDRILAKKDEHAMLHRTSISMLIDRYAAFVRKNPRRVKEIWQQARSK